MIALAALVVAACALGLSFWIAIVTTRPHLDTHSNDFDENEIGVWIENNGLEPAVICSFRLTIDGKGLPEMTAQEIAQETNKRKMPLLLCVPAAGAVIPPKGR